MGWNGRTVSGWARAAARRAGAAALATAVCLVSGCGLLGRSPASLGQDQRESITVTSPMVGQGIMAMRYTCHGAGKSPPIFWSGIPPGTRSLALVVDDADAPITPRLYWIVFDISPATTDIQAGSLPTGARQAQNTTGRSSYDPPCPVGGPHQYRFTVYALSTTLRQPAGTSMKTAWSAIASHAVARGRLTVTAHP